MSMTAGPRRDPKSGSWWFVVDVPTGADGRRRQVKRRGFRTKAEAQCALDEVRGAGRQGVYVAPARQRLGEYLIEDWLPAIRVTVEPSTWASYERYLRLHVVPHLGGVRLGVVDAAMLNRLYADLLDHGRLDGKPGGLSLRSVRYIHTVVGRALSDAVRWGRIVRNPATLATPPRAAQAKSQAPEKRTWDAPTWLRSSMPSGPAAITLRSCSWPPRDAGAVRPWVCGGATSTWMPGVHLRSTRSARSPTGSMRSRHRSRTVVA